MIPKSNTSHQERKSLLSQGRSIGLREDQIPSRTRGLGLSMGIWWLEMVKYCNQPLGDFEEFRTNVSKSNGKNPSPAFDHEVYPTDFVGFFGIL